MTRRCGGQFFNTCPKCGSSATLTYNRNKLFRCYDEYICSVCKYHWKEDEK